VLLELIVHFQCSLIVVGKMFMPLGFVATMFSMTMVPAHTTIAAPLVTLILVAILAHRLAVRPDLVRILFPIPDIGNVTRRNQERGAVRSTSSSHEFVEMTGVVIH
jgi:hypothetical protein